MKTSNNGVSDKKAMQLINKYFNNKLSQNQIEQLQLFSEVFADLNQKINLISRKDIENFQERHILHSLSIAKIADFKPKTVVADVGTGGGLPGIPLAIFFPNVKFVLIDSIKKKTIAVNNIIKHLKIDNAETKWDRVEETKDKYDFIVSRAVTSFPKFVKLVKNNITKNSQNPLQNGIIYLKGGDIQSEISMFKSIRVYNINSFFSEPFFETKKIIYLPNLEI